VGDFSKRTGIDHAPAFFGFLGAISGLANDFIKLQPKQNDYRWTVRPVVWPFAIGGSSSGKSPALEEGMAILQRKGQGINPRKHEAPQGLRICDEAVRGRLRRSKEEQGTAPRGTGSAETARILGIQRAPLRALPAYWSTRTRLRGMSMRFQG
jgi:hypothetical protein